MGLLNIFNKPAEPSLMRLPTGSFTVDPGGRLITSTLPRAFAAAHAAEMAQAVLSAFRLAQEAQVPLTEITVNFSALKLTARELRGGAIIFLSPSALKQK